MATLFHSESRRLYSWWWDSHISPKNSKWLQENLTDMDAKVKAMIKLIEEDADSFARRAEMYYKKRPELMKLVEEFYRAYRALAERYDHATVGLRHAHQTMAEALPNHAPDVLDEDMASNSSGPICALLNPYDQQKDASGLSLMKYSLKCNGGNSEDTHDSISKRGLKQFYEIFSSGDVVQHNSKVAELMLTRGLSNHDADLSEKNLQEKVSQSSSENQNFVQCEPVCVEKGENEVQTLKEALARIQTEKGTILQYQQSLEKLSNLERELSDAQEDMGELDERASKAEIEIKILNEALTDLKAERDASLLQYNKFLERISSLETMSSLAQEDAIGFNGRAIRAETDAQNFKHELSRLEVEKEAGYLQYKQCLDKISALESKVSLAEEKSSLLSKQVERAKTEVEALKKQIAELNAEKEAVALLYKQSLEIIAKMEKEISLAQENSKQLNIEIEIGNKKLKIAEEHCVLLESSNHSLQAEADNLVQTIAMKDKELSEKHNELERLQTLVQEEHSHFIQIEKTLQTLQKIHFQSQEEQKSLELELKNGVQMLKELELCKHNVEEEVRRVIDENRTLNELNLSSTISISNMQNKILKLKEIEEKLEVEVALKAEESTSLQKEICHLEDEMQNLNKRYQAVIEQMDLVGMNPQSFVSLVKSLQDENSKLSEVFKMERYEKETLNEKLKGMDTLSRENDFLESSLSSLNNEMEGFRGALRKLQDSCQVLQEEKSTLLSEKATLLSQLQSITENMQKLLEKNTLMENSLSVVNVEREGLRAKSATLEELCKMLKNEESDLLNERSALVFQLKNIEERLGSLEKRFTILEEKYHGMEKDKETTINQLEELGSSLLLEKIEQARYKESSEAQMEKLENHVHLLQEERRLGKIEFEEQLDKAVNCQVEIFILQRIMEDLEQKNFSLLLECQKHVEASKFSDKVISELESENLEQQMEIEFLIDELQKMKMGIHHIFRVLQFDPEDGNENGMKQEEIPIRHILNTVEDMKGSVLRSQDEKHQLLVENSLMLTFIQELRSVEREIESKKDILEEGIKVMTDQLNILQKDKLELWEVNTLLRSELTKGKEMEELLKSKLEVLSVMFIDLEGMNKALQEENYELIEEKRSLLKNILGLKDENARFEDENLVILHEMMALSIFTSVLESFATEKAMELKEVTEHLNCLHRIDANVEQEAGILKGKFVVTEAEKSYLNDYVEKLEKELQEAKYLNDHLNHQITISEDFIKVKGEKLEEVEARFKAVETLNMEFFRNVEDLKIENRESAQIKQQLEKQILVLSEECKNQKKEINCLDEVNRNLLDEIGTLQREVEDQRIREENLSSELQEKTNEYELWEAEAATFYFDLKVSAIHEVLLENKVNELSGVCDRLKDESAAKAMEIKQMTETVSFLESETGGLKGQLSAYVPVISSLKEDIAKLENIALLRRRSICTFGDGKQKDAEIGSHLHENNKIIKEHKSTVREDGLSELMNMQTRLLSIKMVMVEEVERIAMEESVSPSLDERTLTDGKQNSALNVHLQQEKVITKGQKQMENDLAYDLKSRVVKHETGLMMKDIPLDQASDFPVYRNCRRGSSGTEDGMLELWEKAEQDFCKGSASSGTRGNKSEPEEDVITCYQSEKSQDSSSELQFEKDLGVDKLEISNAVRKQNQQGYRKKILESPASDAWKLTILQANVGDLKKKVERAERSKKGNHSDYVTVKRRIQEVEDALVKLVQINDQMTEDMEESASSLDKKISAGLKETRNMNGNKKQEQAQSASEKIGQLQDEVQNIQYILMKLDDAKKTKEKMNFSLLLKDFIYSSKKIGKKQRKPSFCRCSRPSTNDD